MPHAVSILFVCRGNTGRSHMAAAYLQNILSGDAIAVLSGGVESAYEVETNVKRAMAEEGIFIERARPRLLDAALVQRAHRVIVIGRDVDVGPRLPRIDEWWPVEDPDDCELPAVRLIRDEIKRYVLDLAETIRQTS